jgi:hypothetical protein
MRLDGGYGVGVGRREPTGSQLLVLVYFEVPQSWPQVFFSVMHH